MLNLHTHIPYPELTGIVIDFSQESDMYLELAVVVPEGTALAVVITREQARKTTICPDMIKWSGRRDGRLKEPPLSPTAAKILNAPWVAKSIAMFAATELQNFQDQDVWGTSG